ncbi:VWA domain-containing protein [Pseudovibrio sp. Tun.PSC04-5.I4]|uniref:VWA domain-containing protein n=1 Tax=Pseudovibrio sp. Tun.PSC04-5.I4 TaxID=1798213 RepID=UPI00087E610E|nr:VWA domain-containing protein [Pseudovibrio sp. Tun.PSC04-5.I4]SDR16749.1 Mg-chelatase subunit ChlD [Pseudovibrio sp. Tun.PSC04-5.I4]
MRFIILLFVLLLPWQSASAQNLLVNGGFENALAPYYGDNLNADLSPWMVNPAASVPNASLPSLVRVNSGVNSFQRVAPASYYNQNIGVYRDFSWLPPMDADQQPAQDGRYLRGHVSGSSGMSVGQYFFAPTNGCVRLGYKAWVFARAQVPTFLRLHRMEPNAQLDPDHFLARTQQVVLQEQSIIGAPVIRQWVPVEAFAQIEAGQRYLFVMAFYNSVVVDNASVEYVSDSHCAPISVTGTISHTDSSGSAANADGSVNSGSNTGNNSGGNNGGGTPSTSQSNSTSNETASSNSGQTGNPSPLSDSVDTSAAQDANNPGTATPNGANDPASPQGRAQSFNPSQVDLVKSCTPPAPGQFNGVNGMIWNCQITVDITNASNGQPFPGLLHATDTPQASAGSNVQIMSLSSASGHYSCSNNPTCVIGGPYFDASGSETINVQLFLTTTGSQPTNTVQNCINGAYYLNGAGTYIPGNCITAQWDSSSVSSGGAGSGTGNSDASLDISKTCDPMVSLGNGSYSLTCQLSVTGANLPMGETIVLADLFGGQTGSTMGLLPFLTSFTSVEPWICGTLSQNVQGCTLDPADLAAAGGTSTLSTTTVFQNPENQEQAFNCLQVDTQAGFPPPTGKSARPALPRSITGQITGGNKSAQSQFGDTCVLVDFPKDDDKPAVVVKLEKKCQQLPRLGAYINVLCEFDVVLSSSVTGTITVADMFSQLSGAPVVYGSQIGSNDPQWTCNLPLYMPQNPMACSISGADMASLGNISSIWAQFSFPANGYNTGRFENCGSITLGDTPLGNSNCVPLGNGTDTGGTSGGPILQDGGSLSVGDLPNISLPGTGTPGGATPGVPDIAVGGVSVPNLPNLPNPAPTGPVVVDGGSLSADLNPIVITPIPAGSTSNCGLDTLFLVDTSGSMALHNRMNEVKAALHAAYASFEGGGSSAALVKFSYGAQNVIVPAQTIPSPSLTNATNLLAASGGTNWEAPLARAAGLVQNMTRKPLVLFITDGEPNQMLAGNTTHSTPAISSDGISAAIPRLAAIRSLGSRVIGIGIGPNIPAANMVSLFGSNMVTAGPNTAVDPFTNDVIMIPQAQLSADVFTQIAQAYCPARGKSGSANLSNARKALQHIPVSTSGYTGDDEPYVKSATQPDLIPTPTLPIQVPLPSKPQGEALPRPAKLKVSKAALGACKVDRGRQSYKCRFRLSVKNTGKTRYKGPVSLRDQFDYPRPTRLSLGARNGWSCLGVNRGSTSCLNSGVNLAPGQHSQFELVVTVPGLARGGHFRNCAVLDMPKGRNQRVAMIQKIMNSRGLKAGPVDGKAGKATYRALSKLKVQLGLPRTKDIDRVLFTALGLADRSKQSCARVKLPQMPLPVLKCDRTSTLQKGGNCACRYDRMVQTSATQCVCKGGANLVAGKGCIKPPVVQKPELQCHAPTAYKKGGKCYCKYKSMKKQNRASCVCKKGRSFVPGKGCIKKEATPRPLPTAPKCDPRTTRARGKTCVCIDKKAFKVSPRKCACGDNAQMLAGRCVPFRARPTPTKPNTTKPHPAKPIKVIPNLNLLLEIIPGKAVIGIKE